MPNCYRLAAIVGAIALFSAPALADGYPDRPVNRGPSPLKPHAQTPPEPGCYLLDAATDTWSCPPLPQKSAGTVTTRQSTRTVSAPVTHPATYGATTRRYIDESKTRTYVNRYTTGGECCGGTPRPPVPPPPPPVQKTYVQRGMVIDISGFDGGVGSGVDGGYYGGGGGFAYASASSSASAMSSASASMTFRGGFKGGGGGKHRGGKKKGGGGCGCK